jgi:hypothetical protein
MYTVKKMDIAIIFSKNKLTIKLHIFPSKS